MAVDASLASLERDPDALAAAVGVTVGAEWPPREAEAALGAWRAELLERPESRGWFGWLWLHTADGELIGHGGFKGEPDASGAVEIGYALVPSRQGQGYGSEAVAALVAWALSDPRVRRIDAEASVDGHASIALLRKLGFQELPATDPAVSRFGLVRGVRG